jgi:hypothetical protein
METEISCFYIHYNHQTPINITFIKYQKYFKILFLNNKPIILSIYEFMKIPRLFEWYILSLMTTKEINKVYDNNNRKYGIYCQINWRRYYFKEDYKLIYLENHSNKNPLKSQEPKRQSSVKKIKKFVKAYNYYLNIDYLEKPLELLNELIKKNCRITRY